MTHDDLIDTIRRLLALGQSPNEHEASLAIAKAEELLQRHGLDRAEVEASGSTSEWSEEELCRCGRLPSCAEVVFVLLIRYFLVRGVWSRFKGQTTVTIFGRPHHVAIARYVYAYLCRTFRDLYLAYKRNVVTAPGDAKAYYLGLYRGLSAKLDRQRNPNHSTGSELVVAAQADLDAEFDRKKGHMKARRAWRASGSEEALHAGVRAGLQLQIATAVGAGSEPRAMIAGPSRPAVRSQRGLFE